jgi:xanthine dehydrogenase YagS FAD-binding subunit
MKAFQYVSPRSVESAQELVADHGRYLGGGVDLFGQMKEYLAEPKIVVNVKSLPGLDRIEPGGDRWTLGANVTVAQIEDHPQIKNVFPGLHQAAGEVGSQQIRNVATLGGNLAQHSRCWYYRQRDVLCLKKGGDMCFARHGEHKFHCLFTGNTCISPIVSNLAIALAALDAVATVERDSKPVRMTMAELYAKAWDNPLAHHSLGPKDLIVKVEIPTARNRSVYLQTSEKHEFDWALVSCAVAAKVSGNKLSNARVALGCISPVPHQVEAANAFLEGKTLDEAVAAQAADMILKDAQPLTQNGYKVPIAHALIRRALLQLKA